MVLILGLMLGVGAFLGMKMKGGDAKPKKPEIKMSKEKPAELKEFLVNLAGGANYARIEIGLGMVEGSDPKLIEDHEAPVRDAINMCLKSKTLAELNAVDGLAKLKRELAATINETLKQFQTDKEKAEDKSDKKDSDSKSDKSKASDSKDDKSKDAAKDKEKDKDKGKEQPEHPEWDSDTGPVLKVYIVNLTTE